jgi:PTH1 family peptidyl-tRNA hydrolase
MEPTTGAPAKLIVGLGNPGRRYRDTRHNLGFAVVDELARRRGIGLDRDECGARVGSDAALTLAEPQIYMNRSGYALRCLVERHGFAPQAVLVVYDDVHLPLGRLRLRPGGSPGGHRGMESVLENLRTDAVPRLRLGVQPALTVSGDALADFVLEPFDADERAAAAAMVERAADACEAWLELGVETAMARFNGGGAAVSPAPAEPPD